jgi:hypothetical protein
MARAMAALLLVVAASSACSGPAPSRTIQLVTLNGSGVTGSVTLIDEGPKRTNVVIDVQPAGNLDMPAHIHPGTCDELVPQPRYPLRNVANGHSDTVVPASLDELMAGDLAVNLHRSNEEMSTYTACADLAPLGNQGNGSQPSSGPITPDSSTSPPSASPALQDPSQRPPTNYDDYDDYY